MRAKKQFGQNFLHNQHTLEFIVRSMMSSPGDTIVEIGGGTGNVTKLLAKIPDISLFVVELDRDLVPLLQQLKATVIEGNILDIPLTFAAQQKIVGNLPYYITKPIITHIRKYRNSIDFAVLMVQYEVAKVITALPGESDYSAFSAYIRSFSTPELLKKVSKGEFNPQPNVDSALVKLTIIPDDPAIDADAFADFIFSCFRQRRKTLTNNLKSLGKNEAVVAFLEKTGYRSDARAEMVSVDDFKALFQIIHTDD